MNLLQWQSTIERCHHLLRVWGARHADWVFAGATVLLLRIWFAALGVFAFQSSPQWSPETAISQYHGLEPIPAAGFGVFLAPWQRWDAIWYERIASIGYSADDRSAAFFPLFPILMGRVGIVLDGNFVLAGIVISTIATFFSFVLLYRLSAEIGGSDAAKRAVVYWAIFPTSYYLLGGYAESVLVICALATIYFARRRNWWIAGIAAAGATLARPIGFLILIPAIIEGMRQTGTWRTRVCSVLPLLLGVAIAMGAWMFYLQLAFSDALLWIHAEETWWTRRFIPPWETILLTIRFISEGRWPLGTNIIDLALTCIVLSMIIVGTRRLPLSYTVYALAMLIVPLSSIPQDDFFVALPMAAAGRRVMIIFPAFIVLGKLVRGRWVQPIWIVISLALQAFLFIEFTRWTWID